METMASFIMSFGDDAQNTVVFFAAFLPLYRDV